MKKCKLCFQVTNTVADLQDHILMSHQMQYHCDDCGLSCSSSHQLSQHMKTSHRDIQPVVSRSNPSDLLGRMSNIEEILRDMKSNLAKSEHSQNQMRHDVSAFTSNMSEKILRLEKVVTNRVNDNSVSAKHQSSPPPPASKTDEALLVTSSIGNAIDVNFL